MSINILGVTYDIKKTITLHLQNNNLITLPNKINNLVNLEELFLHKNKLKILPVEILKIKNKLTINETSYEIDNLDLENEFIILTNLNREITNLPFSLKEIWLKEDINETLIKIPFDCEIKYF